jgi:hypothetical protein
MEWYESIERRWREQSLLSAEPGLNENATSDFEAKHGVLLPAEVHLYFHLLNGMSTQAGHDVDENGFSFLPLSAVRSVADFSMEMGWTVRDGVGKHTAFVFVDYLQWSCAYAFETAGPNSGSIYLLGFDMPKLVAPSLREFVGIYLADEPVLYQPA